MTDREETSGITNTLQPGKRFNEEETQRKEALFSQSGVATAKPRLSDGSIGFLGRQSIYVMVAPVGKILVRLFGDTLSFMQHADPAAFDSRELEGLK